MENIKALKKQIKALEIELGENKAKNIHALKNKIKGLRTRLNIETLKHKEQLQIIAENNYWEKYASY